MRLSGWKTPLSSLQFGADVLHFAGRSDDLGDDGQRHVGAPFEVGAKWVPHVWPSGCDPSDKFCTREPASATGRMAARRPRVTT